jgi:tetratricopeptide (TPR) repeat protein
MDTASSYQDDAEYNKMMNLFQGGDWRKGFVLLNTLKESYPSELPELRSLQREMQVRASIDAYEEFDQSVNRRRKFLKYSLRIVFGVVLFIAIFYVLNTYSSWLQDKVAIAQDQVAEEMRIYSLNAKYQSAQQLLASMRGQEALVLLQEIKTADPTYPGLEDAIQTGDKIQQLNLDYEKAMQLKASGKVDEALAILQEMPNYRDVSLQIREIQRKYDLGALLTKGDEAVRQGDWLTAIEQYEDLRNRDAFYQRNNLEERLYNAYLNAAKSILEEQPDSLEALQTAQSYFAKALALRPQDPKVFEELTIARDTVADRLVNKFLDLAKKALTGNADSLAALKKAEEYYSQAQAIRPNDLAIVMQRQMAQTYIQAMADFNKKRWDPAIKALRSIYEQDVDFAEGTARQALYDALIARGDEFILNGRLQSALTDYQEAVTIAQLRPDSLLRLFESQVRVGNALGIMGSYETAVFQYRSALEQANILENLVLDPQLDRTLTTAESNAIRGKYKYAYTLYRDAMDEIIKILPTVEHTITDNDYLARLAKQYNTTVAAILAANGLTDPSQIQYGDKIIIPILP